MPCWDSHHRQVQGSNKKQKVVVEWTCVTCKGRFVTEKKNKKKMEKECKPCAEQRELREAEVRAEHRKKEKRDYYLTYGVGYESPLNSSGDIRFKREMNVSVGTYDLVFYSSNNDGEDIHRTARGALMLSEEEWDGKPALHGHFIIHASLTDGENSSDDPWQCIPYMGDSLSGAFIEHVTDWDPSRVSNGFHIFDDTARDKGTKKFILIKGEFRSSDMWFSDLHELTEDSYWDVEKLSGAILTVVDRPIALGLDPDRLCENEYDPEGATSHNLYNAENGQERAETLTARYRDASTSWVCKHLGVPDAIAFRIREYVTPAPVFYLREGDLVLTMEDSRECEWERILVFRKSSRS